VFAGRYFVQLK